MCFVHPSVVMQRVLLTCFTTTCCTARTMSALVITRHAAAFLSGVRLGWPLQLPGLLLSQFFPSPLPSRNFIWTFFLIIIFCLHHPSSACKCTTEKSGIIPLIFRTQCNTPAPQTSEPGHQSSCYWRNALTSRHKMPLNLCIIYASFMC